ncbi:MAG: hypothetical protein R6X32_03540 [Chloroflexota bacterium]
MNSVKSNATIPTTQEQVDRNDAAHDRFRGKVALLVGQQPAENHDLALRFAHLGANVAVIYRPDLGDKTAVFQQAAHLQVAIEAAGQRCLILPADLAALQAPQALIDTINAILGRLDFFISRSTGTKNGSENGRVYANGSEGNKQHLPYPLPQHQLMIAAMKTILAQ